MSNARPIVENVAHGLSLEQIVERLGSSDLCWLDGAGAHPDARFSYLGVSPVERVEIGLVDLAPFRTLQQRGEQTSRVDDSDFPEWIQRRPQWVGYVSYDAGRTSANLRWTSRHRAIDPVIAFARYDAVLAWDASEQKAWLISNTPEAGETIKNMLSRKQELSAELSVEKLIGGAEKEHLTSIERAMEAIARGDIYQVNLARRWTGRLCGSPLRLYLRMREASPVPYGFFYSTPTHQIACSTMELFLDWDRATRRLVTRPIKGTLARGLDDASEARALVANVKERAEHSMIVDLMRNDLGRVAELSSVRVVQSLAVEPFAKLHHLVSTVECTTREEVSLADVLEATFPPGSVTGTPKSRAVQIIDELEPFARGAYTGGLGYIDAAGGMKLAVGIRLAEIRDGVVQYSAGGGITALSDPRAEVAETELKARVFFEAVAPHG